MRGISNIKLLHLRFHSLTSHPLNLPVNYGGLRTHTWMPRLHSSTVVYFEHETVLPEYENRLMIW